MHICISLLKANVFIWLGIGDDDDDDEELSTGAVIGITFAVTFIITLVVTALVSVIITSLYYKHLIDRIRKSVMSQEGDPHALTEDIKRHDPVYATTRIDIPMDTNPAYAATTH